MYLFIAYHIKHSIYKMKASMCFTLDITTSIQYNILYCNREMLHDGSIRCAQAGGSDQASCKQCFSLACTVGLHGFLKDASTCRIDAPYMPQRPDELDQWRQVLEFKQQFPNEGLRW